VEVPAIMRGSRVPAEEAGKVPAKEGRSSTEQADPTRGKQEGEGSPTTEKYEHGGPRRGHSFSNTDRADMAAQERVQYQRAGPPGQILHR